MSTADWPLSNDFLTKERQDIILILIININININQEKDTFAWYTLYVIWLRVSVEPYFPLLQIFDFIIAQLEVKTSALTSKNT